MIVVITVPFVPVFADANRTKERAKSAVQTFSKTLRQARLVVPHGEIIVVLEQKIPNEAAADGIRSLGLSEKCQLCVCDEFETVGRWYRGIRQAFDSDSTCPAVMVIPGDIENIDDPPKFEKGLRSMIANTTRATLTVGDYTSSDPFKEHFDTNLTHPLLENTFPQSWQTIKKVGIQKVRSEYFCIGSEVFRTFLQDGERWLPFDITMLLMLSVVNNSHLELRKVELGEISDTPTRNMDAAIQQIVRYAFQLWFSGHSAISETELEPRKSAHNKLLKGYGEVLNEAIENLLKFVKE